MVVNSGYFPGRWVGIGGGLWPEVSLYVKTFGAWNYGHVLEVVFYQRGLSVEGLLYCKCIWQPSLKVCLTLIGECLWQDNVAVVFATKNWQCKGCSDDFPPLRTCYQQKQKQYLQQAVVEHLWIPEICLNNLHAYINSLNEYSCWFHGVKRIQNAVSGPATHTLPQQSNRPHLYSASWKS